MSRDTLPDVNPSRSRTRPMNRATSVPTDVRDSVRELLDPIDRLSAWTAGLFSDHDSAREVDENLAVIQRYLRDDAEYRLTLPATLMAYMVLHARDQGWLRRAASTAMWGPQFEAALRPACPVHGFAPQDVAVVCARGSGSRQILVSDVKNMSPDVFDAFADAFPALFRCDSDRQSFFSSLIFENKYDLMDRILDRHRGRVMRDRDFDNIRESMSNMEDDERSAYVATRFALPHRAFGVHVEACRFDAARASLRQLIRFAGTAPRRHLSACSSHRTVQ